MIIDLFNREIIGYAAGKNKNAELVYKAFGTIKTNLSNINIFHTDRGNEFKNKIIDDVLTTFNIDRSLSKKGCPYDNAVAESTYKIIKTEFAFNRIFKSFEELETELFDYVNWYNNFRIHSSLNYLTPVEYKKSVLIKIVQKRVDNPEYPLTASHLIVPSSSIRHSQPFAMTCVGSTVLT